MNGRNLLFDLFLTSEKPFTAYHYLIDLFLLLFSYLCLYLVFIPERLKIPSLFGCIILFGTVILFWVLNFATERERTTPIKTYIPGHMLKLISTAFFSMENITSYFAIRSTMKNKNEFSKVKKLIYGRLYG